VRRVVTADTEIEVHAATCHSAFADLALAIVLAASLER
jgi:hypothetical protein